MDNILNVHFKLIYISLKRILYGMSEHVKVSEFSRGQQSATSNIAEFCAKYRNEMGFLLTKGLYP